MEPVIAFSFSILFDWKLPIMVPALTSLSRGFHIGLYYQKSVFGSGFL